MDLVFIEEAFERLLLDYDRVFSAMAIPACLWRRTGEIYKGNREFAELVGLDSFMLRDVSPVITQNLALTKSNARSRAAPASTNLWPKSLP